MPVPTVYTENQLANFLYGELGDTASVLGWDAGSAQIIEAVNGALLDMDTSDISTLTSSRDIRGLRALGRRALWRAVVQTTASNYSFSSDGQRFDRQQINDHARNALELTETECREWDPLYAVSIVSITRPHDPYAVIPDDERVP